MDEKMTQEPCKECGSKDTSWECTPRNNGQAVDGRICMREVSVQFYRACNCCSETLEVVSAEEFLTKINANLTQPAQAVDALQDAIFQIAERLGEVRDPGMDDMSWHTQLIARAQYLANAQAVDVVAWRWRDDVRPGLPWHTTTDADVIQQMEATGAYEIEPLTRAIGNAQAEALKDARRYRWLRSNACDGFMRADGGSLNCDEPESEWDAWIDASMNNSAPEDGSHD